LSYAIPIRVVLLLSSAVGDYDFRLCQTIFDRAFEDFERLRCVTFELPSQCSYSTSGAFQERKILEAISLPPSVEFIDPTFADCVSPFPFHFVYHFVPGHPHFCVESDRLMSVNGQELVRYLADPFTFCVNCGISALCVRRFAVEHNH
jgi:hypothetical protein